MLRSCLRFHPKSRPPIVGKNGLLTHPFLARKKAPPTSITLTRANLQQLLHEACAFSSRYSVGSLQAWAADEDAVGELMTRFKSEGVLQIPQPAQQDVVAHMPSRPVKQQHRGRSRGESPVLKKSKPTIGAAASKSRSSGGAGGRAGLDAALQNAIKKGKTKKRKKRRSLKSKPKPPRTPRDKSSVQSVLDRRRAFVGLSPTGTDTDSDWTLYNELLQ